jgi:hypothetical protein
MINPINIINEFVIYANQKYPNYTSEVTDIEKSISIQLLRYLDKTISGNYETEEYLDYSDYDSDSDFEDHQNKKRKCSDDTDSDYEIPENIDFIKESKYNFEQMKEIAKYSQLENGKLRSFNSIKNRYRKLNNIREVYRIIDYVEKGGTYKQKVKEVEKYVFEKFDNNRKKHLRICDLNLKKWALKKSHELNFNFKASDSWVLNFKKRYRIKSRKVTKYITKRNELTQLDKKLKAENFVKSINQIIYDYDSSHVLNTDQSGFNYEIYKDRTLTYIGEKDTYGTVNSMYATTHSYSIQPLISLEGRLVGKLLLCLKEINGEFGPNVERDLFKADNVFVVCSTSGKLTKNLVKEFAKNIIKPNINQDFLLLVDSWPGHNKINIYNDVFPNINCNLQIIPPGTTEEIQPADRVLFFQWKYFVKMMYSHIDLEDLNIELRLRNNIIKMQSLIFNQFQSPLFHRMLRYAWYTSGYTNQRPETFETVKEICFEFDNIKCFDTNCSEIAFIDCSICRKILCFTHFFVEYHFHE